MGKILKGHGFYRVFSVNCARIRFQARVYFTFLALVTSFVGTTIYFHRIYNFFNAF